MPQAQLSALVTGASGFVGSHLSRALSLARWRVVASSRQPAFKASLTGVSSVCLCDSSESAAWQSALDGVSCVVHLAARVHVMGSSRHGSKAFREANVVATRRVAEEAAKAGVRRFVFLSSIKVNGEGGGPEPYRADDAPQPVDPYGQSKLEAERMLREFCTRSAMELVIIRAPLVYGPGVRANFRRLMRLAEIGLPLPLRSIENRRSLVSVWNLASFIELCLTHPRAAQQVWLISDGEDLSTPDLLRRLSRLFHRRDRLFPFPPRLLQRFATMVGIGAEMRRLCESLTLDSAPARECLAWRPAVTVDEALARTVDAYSSARGK